MEVMLLKAFTIAAFAKCPSVKISNGIKTAPDLEQLSEGQSECFGQFLSLILNIINQTTPGRHFVGSKTQFNFIKLRKYVKGCSEHNK